MALYRCGSGNNNLKPFYYGNGVKNFFSNGVSTSISGNSTYSATAILNKNCSNVIISTGTQGIGIFRENNGSFSYEAKSGTNIQLANPENIVVLTGVGSQTMTVKASW